MATPPSVIEQAFNFLQLIFLIIPVIAILLQTMVMFYTTNDVESKGWKIGVSFATAMFSFLVLIISGIIGILVMNQEGAAQSIVIAAGLTIFGLALVAVVVILMMSDIVRSPDNTEDNASTSTGQQGYDRIETEVRPGEGQPKLIRYEGENDE